MDPQRYQGILVADSYAQITSSISKTLSPEHALFFAEPFQDAGGEAIDWYTGAEGPLVNLMDLPPDRLAAAEAKIQSLASTIEADARSLCESQESSKNIRGNILQLALRYPGREYIFMAGDQPVLTGWGFAPATAGAQVEDLIRFGHATPKPAPAAQAAPDPIAAPVPPTAARSAKGSDFDWKRALLALLAGLLILLALYFLAGLLFGEAGCSGPGISGCSSTPAVSSDGGGTGGSSTPGSPSGGSGASPAPGGSSGSGCAASFPAMGGCSNTPPPAAAPQLSGDGLRELQSEQEKTLSLQRRIEELQRQLALRVAECPREQPKEEPLVQENPPQLADLLPTTPEAELEPIPEKTPEPPKQPAPPKQPEKPKQQAKGQDMEIPKDAAKNNDLSFLEGCWTSETGLHNSNTGEPIVVTYCFDANGGGTRTINGQQKGDRCVGPVRAKFQGKNLVFNADGASCGKSGGYYGQDVNCTQGSNNKAQCTGKERGGKRNTWKARFRRS